MKMTMLVLAVALSLQSSAPIRTPLSALAGKWVTTEVPREGEAPMIQPTFTIDVKGDVVTVTLGMRAPITAAVFRNATVAEDVSLLLLKKTAPGPLNTFYIIRPTGAGQVRFEEYDEYTDGSSKANSYYAETFKKAK